MKHWLNAILFLFLFSNVYSQVGDVPTASSKKLPYFLRSSDEWAQDKLLNLSLEEKIAQSFMVPVWPNRGERDLKRVDSLISNYNVGGIIVFQGTPSEAKSSISQLKNKSKLPLLVGIDAEWGSAMRLWPQDNFPYQLTMGAANDAKQTEIIASAMADELIDLGVNLSFSPVMDVNTNPDNPIIGFRSFGASPTRVGNLGSAMIKGLERKNVLSCMKHFPGHGDTDVDSHLELPTINKTAQEIEIIDATPFKIGRLAGASAVMMAHLNVPALDDSGTPSSLSRKIIHDYLKKKLKFDGLIISDALNMKAVSEKYGQADVAAKAYYAGNDILLYPLEVENAIQLIVKMVENGEMTTEEVDERCLKILRAKYHTEVAENKRELVQPEKLEYARMAIAEKSLTVLKDKNAFPLKDVNSNILVVNIGSNDNSFLERSMSYLPQKPDYIHAYSAEEVLRLHEEKIKTYDYVFFNIYASNMWPFNDYFYPKGWREMLRSIPEEPITFVGLFGNPYAVNDSSLFNKVNGVTLCYENSPYSTERYAQLVFGAFQPKNGLPVNLHNQYDEGFKIELPKASRLKYTVPEELNADRNLLAQIDSIAINGIREKAFPSCQIVAAKDGKVFYQKSFGHHTYDSLTTVDNSSIYDLASITKVAATTISLMQLQDQNKFSLNSRLKKYRPDFYENSSHGNIKVKEMLAHQAGLTPWIPFYLKTVHDGQPLPQFYSQLPNDSVGTQVAENLYIQNTYEDYMMSRILTTRIKPGNKYKYSDVGYYHLKQIIEEITDEKLNEFVLNSFYKPMGLTTMRYLPLNYFDKNRIVPTEQDNYFRNQLVHGHVHDMGAAMTGGVNGHAGLFSNATDLTALMQMLLNGGVYGGVKYLEKETIEEYTSCQFCPKNRRGAGFDKPVTDLDGGPTCDLVSLKSFGHSGFTGTYTWADPEHGINYTFLSNRVYPSAENWKIVKMNIRTDIQRLIYESVGVGK